MGISDEFPGDLVMGVFDSGQQAACGFLLIEISQTQPFECVGGFAYGGDHHQQRMVGVFADDLCDVPYSFGGFYRSEEHTSELQSLMRISYAFFCLKKKKT